MSTGPLDQSCAKVDTCVPTDNEESRLGGTCALLGKVYVGWSRSGCKNNEATRSTPPTMDVQYGQAILDEAWRLLGKVMTHIVTPDDLGGWPAGYDDELSDDDGASSGGASSDGDDD